MQSALFSLCDLQQLEAFFIAPAQAAWRPVPMRCAKPRCATLCHRRFDPSAFNLPEAQAAVKQAVASPASVHSGSKTFSMPMPGMFGAMWDREAARRVCLASPEGNGSRCRRRECPMGV